MASKPKGGGGITCSVVNCANSKKKNKDVSFFSFPMRNQEQRQLWISAIKRIEPDGRPWQPSKWSKVCSDHFVGGNWSPTRSHPAYVPTIFPTGHVSSKTTADVERFTRRKKRNDARRYQEQSPSLILDENELEELSSKKVGCQTDFVNISCSEFVFEAEAHSVDSTHVQEKREHVQRLKNNGATIDELFMDVKKLWELEDQMRKRRDVATQIRSNRSVSKGTQGSLVQSKSAVKEVCVITDQNMSSNDQIDVMAFGSKQFKAFTGTTKEMFAFFLEALGSKLSSTRKMSREQKLLLFLMKLKLNLSFTVLGAMYFVSDATAGHWFYEVKDAMKTLAELGVCWFDRATVQARMPKSFRTLYPKTRCIIDCTELFIQKPGTQRQRVQMYSHYKSHFTIKYLIACAPSGETMFISRGYGGRTTDTEITVQSGFIDLIEVGDTVLADKGFPRIEADLNTVGGILVMPPFKSGDRQFSEAQNLAGYQCASVRIHVERNIARLKTFDILSYVPTHLLKHMDDIMFIICFITNCYTDLINQDGDE